MIKIAAVVAVVGLVAGCAMAPEASFEERFWAHQAQCKQAAGLISPDLWRANGVDPADTAQIDQRINRCARWVMEQEVLQAEANRQRSLDFLGQLAAGGYFNRQPTLAPRWPAPTLPPAPTTTRCRPSYGGTGVDCTTGW